MLGLHVGDFIAVDPNPEFSNNGFINSRHLDNKAGAALTMAAAKAIIDSGQQPSAPVNLVFTISEEVGSGASMPFDLDVSEMIAVDNGTCAPGQNSSEYGVTIAMMDSTAFDYHLNRHLIDLCQRNGINFQRDVFRFYRCDAAAASRRATTSAPAWSPSASTARMATSAPHHSLRSVAQLLYSYAMAEPVNWNDRFAVVPS